MRTSVVRPHRSDEPFAREDHLAQRIAELATDSVEVDYDGPAEREVPVQEGQG